MNQPAVSPDQPLSQITPIRRMAEEMRRQRRETGRVDSTLLVNLEEAVLLELGYPEPENLPSALWDFELAQEFIPHADSIEHIFDPENMKSPDREPGDLGL